jgi:ATP-binding cassette subfamily G (WHITE) protein 2
LANRNRKFTGKLLANGRPVEAASFNGVLGYVTQDDVFLENLTVREQLFFSAMLRLPSIMPKEDKLGRIDQVIEQLGLGACQNTRIGGNLVRGVSGGERKRCNIGVEMISNPSMSIRPFLLLLSFLLFLTIAPLSSFLFLKRCVVLG